MTLVVAETGEVLDPAEHLSALADRIRFELARGDNAWTDLVDVRLTVGRCLLDARDACPSNQEFGEWFKAQRFNFTQQWARVLQVAAAHEDGMRDALQSQLCNGRTPNFEKVVKQVAAAAIGAAPAEPEPKASAKPVGLGHAGTDDEPQAEPTVFPCIVIDPPWRYDNKVTRGAAEDHYPTMSMDDLRAMELPAADDAHLYLWVTNPFMREGFEFHGGDELIDHLLTARHGGYKLALAELAEDKANRRKRDAA